MCALGNWFWDVSIGGTTEYENYAIKDQDCARVSPL